MEERLKLWKKLNKPRCATCRHYSYVTIDYTNYCHKKKKHVEDVNSICDDWVMGVLYD